jgi:hypothetical protein
MLKKIILFFVFLLIAVSSLIYYVSDVSKYIYAGKTINVLIFVEGSVKTYPGTLKIALCQYNPLKKRVQILFINENTAILRKKLKTRTLKELFFRQSNPNRIDFIKREVANLFKGMVEIDYYVYSDTDSLNAFLKLLNECEMKKKLGNSCFYIALNSRNHLNGVITSIKIIKYTVSNINRSLIPEIIKFLKNKNIIIQTDFKPVDLVQIYRIIKNINTRKDIMFIDMPTVIRRNRTEIDQEAFDRVIEMLNGTYPDNEAEKINLKVLNSSNKNRLAEKAVNLLRKNSFDVFYWGNESRKNKFTVVLDMINNPEKSNEIVNLLGCGEILGSANPKPFADMTVLLGNDCILYDKIDKIN